MAALKGLPRVFLIIVASAASLLAGWFLLTQTSSQTATSQVVAPKKSSARNSSAGTEPIATPDNFDWEAYKFYSPDLANLTESEARQHYLREGRRQGRICRRPPLFLTYDAYGGLCNQLLAHIEGLALAYNLNATALTAYAYSRSSFHTRGADPIWSPQPLESLLDFEAWAAYWRGVGVRVAKSTNTSGCAFVDLTTRQKLPDERHPYRLTSDLSRWPDPMFTLPEALAQLAGHISRAARPRLKANPTAAHCVHLDLENPATIFNLPRSQPYMPPITLDAWPFAPKVVRAADSILAILAARKHMPFLGVHLRIESDFLDRLQSSTTAAGPIDAYINAMRSANFSNTSAVYFASAIFGHDEAAVAELQSKLTKQGLCGVILHKTALVEPGELEGLHSEQLALIDLLVLSRAERYVGDPRSSFSMFLREYRLLRGVPRQTFIPVTPDTYMESITAFAQPP